MMKADVPIISGNFNVNGKLIIFIEIFMGFSLESNWIQIHMVFPFFTVQFLLLQNSSAQHNLFITFIGDMKFQYPTKLVSSNK